MTQPRFGRGRVTAEGCSGFRAEAIRSDLSAYPNVKRWLGKMKALKNWSKVNEVFDGFAASMKDVPFETL